MPPTAQTESMIHSAALIAGGKSTRMGRDKAALVFAGRPLWQAQLAALSATHPAELFVAGKCAPISDPAVEIIPDFRTDCGPLGGIAAALLRARSPWLLVLAVDMPAMTPDFLANLVRSSAERGHGLVPTVDGKWEPLAAVYPTSCATIAEQMLEQGRFALHHFIEAACDAGLLAPYPVAESDAALFANLNTPSDAARLLEKSGNDI